MEPGAASRLTARKRRAGALIAVSGLALTAAGWARVPPTLCLGEAANPKTIPAGRAAQTPSPPAIYPTMYDFATPTLGLAVVARPSETTVFKTVDEGKHWKAAGRVEGSYNATIQFLDASHGFVVTRNP